MDVEICIEKDRTKPKIVVHTNEVTSEINEMVKRISALVHLSEYSLDIPSQ